VDGGGTGDGDRARGGSGIGDGERGVGGGSGNGVPVAGSGKGGGRGVGGPGLGEWGDSAKPELCGAAGVVEDEGDGVRHMRRCDEGKGAGTGSIGGEEVILVEGGGVIVQERKVESAIERGVA